MWRFNTGNSAIGSWNFVYIVFALFVAYLDNCSASSNIYKRIDIASDDIESAHTHEHGATHEDDCL
ncbi:MAG: hypothetical protein NVS4B7_07410 [Ktedonobacteraceae bacterium]